jgi:NhaP-type Na+/H+ or K+/H+ antiporter
LLVLLPTLVFETAYNLDIQKLLANRLAIFMLTLSGVVISTLVVAILVRVFTPLDWHLALLLDSIVSAFDEQMETIRHQYQRPIFSLRPKPQSGLLGSIKS